MGELKKNDTQTKPGIRDGKGLQQTGLLLTTQIVIEKLAVGTDDAIWSEVILQGTEEDWSGYISQ